MFREFNVKFEDVEMLGGTDNLLENTRVTKVISKGDNKMSSLDSTFKNCKELDTIDGQIDLNGVSDIDNMLENTELVKSISLKNINNENISANNSFPHIEEINIGGELYNKKAMQNVIASRDWTFDNVNYQGTVGDNIVTKEINIIDDNKVTIQDTLEQKAKGIEITGQTYENLVVGSGEATLLDELTLESVDGSTKEFNPHVEQPVCVETIEGETYQNLVNGKGEYKLTDTFSTTWTESNNSIENPPSVIEIPEIWGNTVQGYANVVSAQQIVDAINGSIASGESWLSSNNNETFVVRSSGASVPPTSSDNFIQLKANTTYTIRCYRLGSTQNAYINYYLGNTYSTVMTTFTGKTFTTDSSGKVLFYPIGVQGGQLYLRVVEGEVDLMPYDYNEFTLNDIQSVGDLYVDESGEPILDEEGNEQYKLEIESSGKNLFCDKILKVVNKVEYNGKTCYIGRGFTSDNSSFQISNIFKANTQYTISFNVENPNNATWAIMHIQYSDFQYATTINFANTNTNRIVLTSREGYSISHIHVTSESGKDLYLYNIQLEENSATEYEPYQLNKTTILMPQPLRRIKGYSPQPYYKTDRLYWDYEKGNYFIEKYVDEGVVDLSNCTVSWSEYAPSGYYNITFDRKDIYDNIKTKFTIGDTNICAICTDFLITTPYWLVYQNNNNFKPSECISFKYANNSLQYRTTNSNLTSEDLTNMFRGKSPITVYGGLNSSQIIETKILEKPLLETYSPKTYISTNTEIQPSQMNIVNKKSIFKPLGLQPSKDYTLQLDSIGVNNEFNLISLGEWKFYNSTQIRMHIKFNNMPNNIVSFNNNSSKRGSIEFINSSGAVFNVKWLDTDLVIPNDTVSMYLYIHECTLDAVLGIQPKLILKNKHCFCANLGGDNVLIENTNDTSTHHKVVVRTPVTLTTDKLDLSGEGVIVNDVMLFEGGSNEIKQDVEYVEGIQNTGELQEDGTYKIDILSTNDISNLITEDVTMVLGAWDDSGTSVTTPTEIRCKNPFTPMPRFIKNGDVLFLVLSDTSINSNTNLHQYDSNKKYTSGQGASVSDFINGVATITIKDISKIQYFSFRAISSNTKCKWGLYLENNGFIEKIESTQSILLPQPLNKIGDIKDKFYWDEDKGHYCIEQNIFPMVLDGSQSYGKQWGNKGYNCYAVNTSNPKKQYGYTIISDKLSVGGECYTSPRRMLYVAWNTVIYIVLEEEYNIKSWLSDNPVTVYYLGDTPTIIDLPHLNKKYSLDTYMPTTYLECANTSIQPSRLFLESDLTKYKPTALETNTDYTVQFECKEKSNKKVKLNLGGTEKEVDAEVGLNHVSITTPSEIDTSLYKDRLFLSGVGNKVADVIVVEGEMNQYPNYFDGIQNTGELQDDGTYKIGILTNEGFNISIISNSPLAKGDRLYWNKSNKRYEIDRGGSIEVPTVSGDVIDLPRLYQREDTHFSISTGNIKPSKIKLDYNDLD